MLFWNKQPQKLKYCNKLCNTSIKWFIKILMSNANGDVDHIQNNCQKIMKYVGI